VRPVERSPAHHREQPPAPRGRASGTPRTLQLQAAVGNRAVARAVARHGARAVASLPHTAGNRAVAQTLAPAPAKPTLARCGGGTCTCGGACGGGEEELLEEGDPRPGGTRLLQRDLLGDVRGEGQLSPGDTTTIDVAPRIPAAVAAINDPKGAEPPGRSVDLTGGRMKPAGP
jgi:hypothetical protein